MSSTTIDPRLVNSNPLVQLNRSRARLRWIPHGTVIVIIAIGVFFAHEFGHALVAQFFGARVVMFNVLGMQWFPSIQWMPHLGYGGYVYWFAPVSGDVVHRTNHRLIMMAGSNFTLVLAISAVGALSFLPVRGTLRTTLAVMSLYFMDSLVHALPIMGLIPPGWNSRFTRTFSEAYFAAVGLGMPSQIYLGAIVLLSILITLFLVRALRR